MIIKNKIMKPLHFLFGIFIVLLSSTFLSCLNINVPDPEIVMDIILFPEVEDTIYVRAMSWGISGNHNQVMFSGKEIIPSNRKPVISQDLIFHSPEVFVKKQGPDTLIIFVNASSIEEKSVCESCKVKILVKKLNSYSEWQDYNTKKLKSLD